jgi:DsbC/DsbD-like thiol-disulfide interchange protein
MAAGFAYVAGMKKSVFAATSVILALLAAPALAFSQDDVLTGRLLPGWRMENGNQMAAMALRLSPGWKTYWRAPGEAGIPPEFDWSGSENIKSVRLHWPSPAVFHSNGLQTVGYHDALVLPVEITPLDPARPVRVRLRVDLGVCNDICMPAELRFEGDLSTQGKPDAAIRAALADQPRRGAEAGLRAISCTVAPISDGLRVTARIDLPKRGPEEVVVIENGDRSVWVSEAETERQGITLVSSADMVSSGGGAFALDRKGVTVTILGEGRAVEIAGCPAP